MTSVKKMMTHAGIGVLAASAGAAVPVPGMAPAESPHCPSRGTVDAWKIFNGDQAPGFGAAFLDKGYVNGTRIPSYVCFPGQGCTLQYETPPLPLENVTTYIRNDAGYGPTSRDLDLQAITTLEALQTSAYASDRFFAGQLKHAFTQDPQLGTELAADGNIRVNTSAAFLGQFWSNIPGLQTALQTTPSLIGLFYNLIAAAGSNGTAIVRQYMGR